MKSSPSCPPILKSPNETSECMLFRKSRSVVTYPPTTSILDPKASADLFPCDNRGRHLINLMRAVLFSNKCEQPAMHACDDDPDSLETGPVNPLCRSYNVTGAKGQRVVIGRRRERFFCIRTQWENRSVWAAYSKKHRTIIVQKLTASARTVTRIEPSSSDESPSKYVRMPFGSCLSTPPTNYVDALSLLKQSVPAYLWGFPPPTPTPRD